MLKRGDLDLLFAPTEELTREPDFSVEELGRFYPRLFCRKGHPILSEPQISLEMIEQYRVISPDYFVGYAQRFAEFLLQGDVDPRRRLHIIENFVVTQTVVAESDLIGIVSSTYGSTHSFQMNFALLDLDVFLPEYGRCATVEMLPACLFAPVLQRFENSRPMLRSEFFH